MVCFVLWIVDLLRYLSAIYDRVLSDITFASSFTLAVDLLRKTFDKLSINMAVRVNDVVSAVNIFLFIEGHLLIDIILTSLPFFLFHQ